MSDPNEKARLKQVREEAAYWYVLFSENRWAGVEEPNEFCAWLRRSPEHVKEMIQIARFSNRISRRRVRIREDELPFPDPNVIPFPNATTRTTGRARAVPQTASCVKWAAVAMVTVMFIGTSSFAPVFQNVDTGPRQVESMLLADGSTVHLGPHTKISIEFSESQRLIHLSEGTGVFEVSPDVHRPFIVRTYLIDAVAVGTRFGVAIEDGVTTTVSEGIVKIQRRGTLTPSTDVRVIAGQQLHASDDVSAPARVVTVDARSALAWSAGWVILHDETLAGGVAAFNPFNKTQIVIGSPALAQRPLPYYRFRLHAPEEFATAVAESPDVALIVDRAGDRLILVSENPAAPPTQH